MGKRGGESCFIVNLPKESYLTLEGKLITLMPVVLTNKMHPMIEFYKKKFLIRALSSTFKFEEEFPQAIYLNNYD